MDNQDNVQTESASGYLPKFCPSCGDILVKEFIAPIWEWSCPTCGYTEPVLPGQ